VADLAALRQRLEGIAEDLGNAAMDALREAIDAGATRRPDLERRLTKARRAVERAIVALGDGAGEDPSLEGGSAGAGEADEGLDRT
jgi:hypothetical protein